MQEILITSLLCRDENAKNKNFLIRREEVFKGKIINNDSLISCKNRVFPIIPDKDTLNYKINLCDKTIFLKEQKEHKIIFGGKISEDSLKVIIDYPSMSIPEKLKAHDDYIFKPLQEANKDGLFEIEIGKEYPVIALTPPFKGKGGFSSYCLINSREPKNFYKEFDIQRYYIFYLTIK